MRLIKGFLIAFGALIMLVGVGIVYITQVLDPNDLKPTLVRSAERQQITLEINGPIEWSFYPWLGVSVAEIVAESPNGRLEAARLEGSVSVLSLFSDTLIIDRLTAISPNLTLNTAPKPPTSRGSSGSTLPAKPLVIRELAVTDGQLSGLPHQIRLEQLNITVDTLSPGAESRLEVSARALHPEGIIPIEISTAVVPAIAFDSLTFLNPRVKSRDLDLQLQGYLSAEFSGALSGEGRIELQPFSPRAWLRAANLPVPNTRDLDTLGSMQGSLDLKWSDSRVSMQTIFISMDESRLKGSISLDLAQVDLNADLTLTALNLDRYVQAEKGSDTPTPNDKNAVFPLPGAYRFNAGAIRWNGIDWTDVGIELGVQPEEITLGRFDVSVFGGQFRSSGTHLVAPQISSLSGTIEGIQLDQWPLNAPFEDLAGTVTGTYDLRFAGRTPEEAQSSLSGPLRLQIADAKLGALDVSNALCQVMNQPIRELEGSTDSLNARVDLKEGLANIESLNAKVANIGLSASGRFSLVSSALNLNGQAAIPTDGVLGTCDAPEAIRGLTVPLSCRGQLNSQQLSCGLDRQAIQQSLSQALQRKAEDRITSQLKEKVDEALKGRLDGPAQDLLKNLLSR